MQSFEADSNLINSHISYAILCIVIVLSYKLNSRKAFIYSTN